MNPSTPWLIGACLAGALTLTACNSMKAPATADVAVSQAAVENASQADGTEFAPVDMQAAREKLALATWVWEVGTNRESFPPFGRAGLQ